MCRSRLRALYCVSTRMLAQIAVDAVGQREVDDAIQAAERHGRLGAVARQRLQACALAAGQNQRQNVFHEFFRGRTSRTILVGGWSKPNPPAAAKPSFTAQQS